MMPRLLTTAWIVGLLWLSGCNYPLIRSQSPEAEDLAYLAEEEPTTASSSLATARVPLGLKLLKIEGVGAGQRSGRHGR